MQYAVFFGGFNKPFRVGASPWKVIQALTSAGKKRQKAQEQLEAGLKAGSAWGGFCGHHAFLQIIFPPKNVV